MIKNLLLLAVQTTKTYFRALQAFSISETSSSSIFDGLLILYHFAKMSRMFLNLWLISYYITMVDISLKYQITEL